MILRSKIESVWHYHLTEKNTCAIVKSGNAQARLVVSTMGFKAAVVATLAAYFYSLSLPLR